ncbi:hypothetical protein MXMO3_03550 (plasmid) [Maritalea myrionectae]|uniref:Uncharacterized protein n=1 Tax=Maritalea myrionectae TaxID=454601 RepID=A0A2R4MJ84_9HYPH|nr:hypothetical protein MXMO3_03550 [Maritalea myrionectae]
MIIRFQCLLPVQLPMHFGAAAIGRFPPNTVLRRENSSVPLEIKIQMITDL